MRKGKTKKPIKYAIERALLSDVLPYETPIIFSNRHFYRFLVKYKIKYCPIQKEFSWVNCKDEETIQQVVTILFDVHGEADTNRKKLTVKESRKIPFYYRITHKKNDFRVLGLPHPKSQVELVALYESFKELIIYYSKQSPFSIRRPETIAKFVYTNDRTYKKKKGEESDLIEQNDKEYKSLKTFFTYEKYSNIYKFYEDYIYHRAEKKYDKMLKFDLAKCFDSIYTHSISWSLLGKDFIKNNLDKEGQTFAGKFDEFMRDTNYGETNGIIIGPEFSRIFAEIILQGIDKSVEIKLGNNKIFHKVHYEIYRYVDDFFLFFNDDTTKDAVLENYKIALKEYKMTLNDSKTIPYEKPLITEITIAKNKIVNLLREKIKFKAKKEKTNKEKDEDGTKKGSTENKIKVSDVDIRCNSNKLITEFKTIIVVSKVSYKDVMNYTLAIIKTILTRNIKKYEDYKKRKLKNQLAGFLTKEEEKKLVKQEYNFTKYTTEMLDFVFFLYGVSPRVNSTIKLVAILSLIIKSFKKRLKLNDAHGKKYALYNQFQQINQEIIFKKISDEIILTLERNKLKEHVQIETLYLLVVLKELGKNYRLPEEQLVKYLNLLELKNADDTSYKPKRYKFDNEINYFVIIVLLFYFKDIKRYKGLKVVLKNAIRKKIGRTKKSFRSKNSELVLLLFDLLACPYLNENNNKFKKELLTCFGVLKPEHESFITFINRQKYWFTKWDNFNLVEELNAKSSLEPYS
ncbi:antiviral reverse transcriptase Drt3b [Maribacter sp. 2210JD10-5]|uniref:antiviral reverse transcriptase Drt3b n=1 Tax=Maribacter sp. 2210JD10-5 TaxID=3386272 RepID=UPI0039BC3BDA